MTQERSYTLQGEAATERLGAAVAAVLKPGLRIYLHGDLGAGKTTLVRGLLRRLGYRDRVKSPTYALVEVYELSSLYLYHFDFYRFEKSSDWTDAGFRDAFAGDSVCLVEWPEKASPRLPAADLEIYFSFLPDAREARVVSCTSPGEECLNAIPTSL